jgi:hypothetical protein
MDGDRLSGVRNDIEERIQLAERLPGRIESIRGQATNDEGTVRVTTTVHGALADLELSERALALGTDALGAEIVRLAQQANLAAVTQGVDVLSQAFGEVNTMAIAESVGLAGQPEQAVAAHNDDDHDAMIVDFAKYRADR